MQIGYRAAKIAASSKFKDRVGRARVKSGRPVQRRRQRQKQKQRLPGSVNLNRALHRQNRRRRQRQRQRRPPQNKKQAAATTATSKTKATATANRRQRLPGPALRDRPLHRQKLRQKRKSRRDAGATLRIGVAGSQDESPCGAIHKFDGNAKFNGEDRRHHGRAGGAGAEPVRAGGPGQRTFTAMPGRRSEMLGPVSWARTS